MFLLQVLLVVVVFSESVVFLLQVLLVVVVFAGFAVLVLLLLPLLLLPLLHSLPFLFDIDYLYLLLFYLVWVVLEIHHCLFLY